MLSCRECKKVKPQDQFSKNRYTGNWQVNCDECAERKLQYARWYRTTKNGKATRDKWKRTQSGKDAIAKVNKKTNRKTTSRNASDPVALLVNSIRQNAAALLSGRSKTSPKFLRDTGIDSEDAFLAHVHSTLSNDMSKDGYGTTWTLEHLIPCSAFDFSTDEDIKRCWQLANLSSSTRVDNSAKNMAISRAVCEKVGPESFPSSWNGNIPSDAWIEEFNNSRWESMRHRRV